MSNTQPSGRKAVSALSAAVIGAVLCTLTVPVHALTPIATGGPAEAAAPSRVDARFDLSVINSPVRNVLAQIAEATGWNILVPAELSGDVNLNLRRATVPDALEALRVAHGLHYRINGTTAQISSSTPHTRVYQVHYLPGTRAGSSELRVSSSSITSGSNSGAGNASGGDASAGGRANRTSDAAEVRTRVDADFWAEVQAALNAIVGLDDVPAQRAPAPIAMPAGSVAGAGIAVAGPGMMPVVAGAAGAQRVAAAAPQTAAAPAAAAAQPAGTRRSVSLNPAAGLIIVRATPAEHDMVAQYLNALQLAVERQVMLEAKIIEVTLSSDSQTGINWAGFGRLPGTRGQLTIGSAAPGTRLGTTGALTTADQTSIVPGAELVASALSRGFYGLAFQAANFATLLNFLQTQGDVQVLSSPRIATLNNQKAVLKVGADELFVTGVSTTTTASASGNVTTPSVQLQPFFSGISLDVTPQIDAEGNVMLHVHPTISTVAEKSKVIDLGSLGSFKLPLASSAINETDSVVRVRDGQIVALGGLMRQLRLDERSGLPVLQDVPVVGGAFRQTSSADSKRELVILLKPTIITADKRAPLHASDDLAGLGGAALSIVREPQATPAAAVR